MTRSSLKEKIPRLKSLESYRSPDCSRKVPAKLFVLLKRNLVVFFV